MKNDPIIEVLPKKYETPEIKMLPTHSQGFSGLCWAFATLLAVELKILRLYPRYKDHIYLSAPHMRYSCYHNFPKVNKETWGVPFKSTAGPDKDEFSKIAMAYFSRGSGPIYHFQEPLKATLEQRTFPEIENDPIKCWFVSDMSSINSALSNAERMEIIKHAVKNHGAVVTFIDYVDRCFSNNTYYFYSDKYIHDTTGKHAVTIVGWDDNISKSNFNNKQYIIADGAFLVRDSALGKAWWISYEDSNILSNNFYIEDVRTWHQNQIVYQNNHYGAIFYNYRPLIIKGYVNDGSFVIKVHYEKKVSERQRLKNIILFYKNPDTNIQVYLSRNNSDSTNQDVLLANVIVSGYKGYASYSVDKLNPNGVFLEADDTEFYIKLVYWRNGDCYIPFENIEGECITDFTSLIPKKKKGEEFFILKDSEIDKADTKYGRIGVKLIAEPAEPEWDNFCKHVDDYDFSQLIKLPSKAHNLADNYCDITWSIWEGSLQPPSASLVILGDSIINKSAETTTAKLKAVFSKETATGMVRHITRFYDVSVLPACFILHQIVLPKANERTFQACGESPIPNATVKILMKQDNQNGIDEETIIGSGISGQDGSFTITCNVLNEGVCTIWAKMDDWVSASQTVDFPKDYTEKESEEEDPDTKKKRKKKEYKPNSDKGFYQALKAALAFCAAGGAAYLYYEHKAEIDAMMAGGLRNIRIRNGHFYIRHFHVDSGILSSSNDFDWVFASDIPEDYTFFESMERCTITGVKIHIPYGMTFAKSMGASSLMDNNTFIRYGDVTSKVIKPVVQEMEAGKITNSKLTGELPDSVFDDFSGFIGIATGGEITNCTCTLSSSKADSAIKVKGNFSGIVGSASNFKIKNCSFTGKVEAGKNASGIVNEAFNTTICQCKVEASLTGNSVSGIAAYAMAPYIVEECLVTGSYKAQDAVGGICATFRSLANGQNSSIKNCIISADVEIVNSTPGKIGYAGGVIAVAPSENTDITISNCLVAGTVHCTDFSQGAGICCGGVPCSNNVIVCSELLCTNGHPVSLDKSDALSTNKIYNQIEAKEGFWQLPSMVDSHVFTRKETYQGLGWDFESVWQFHEDGYPILRADSQQLAYYFPFVKVNSLSADNSMTVAAGQTIMFSGIYAEHTSNIHFKSMLLDNNKQNILTKEELNGLADGINWSLTFGTLAISGDYTFIIAYKRKEIEHTVQFVVKQK